MWESVFSRQSLAQSQQTVADRPFSVCPSAYSRLVTHNNGQPLLPSSSERTAKANLLVSFLIL
jgi:hypothetical protein